MHSRRPNTVHDLAALRIHRDGTRVRNSDSNLSSRRAKYSVRDTRSNWIARDAGGLGTVKQRRSRAQMSESEEHEDGSTEDDVNKGKGHERESGNEEEEKVPSRKARKRIQFDEDLSYLHAGPSRTSLAPTGEHLQPPQSQAEEALTSTLPVPSSDLLKCLHYFASTYYTSMGQLHDATSETRKQRRLRQVQNKSKAARLSQSLSELPGSDNTQRPRGEATGDDEESDEPGSGQDNGKGSGAKKNRRKPLNSMDKDMYKLLDGSALMALGMLLQEHIAERLEPKIPPEWDKEMADVERELRVEEGRARAARRMNNLRNAVKSDSYDDLQMDDRESTEEDVSA